MPATDLKKQFRELYSPPDRDAALVDVPDFQFLMIDGTGDPNGSPEFQQAAEALYSLAYTLKFLLKKTDPGLDYTVMPLEGLWWTDTPQGFAMDNRAAWQWTLMIMQPDAITAEQVAQARQQAARKKALPALDRVRFERLHEGRAAQIMHIGPYVEEPATIARLHAAIAARGLTIAGKHHEIYLGDPRRTAPEKLKTVIRYPVAAAP